MNAWGLVLKSVHWLGEAGSAGEWHRAALRAWVRGSVGTMLQARQGQGQPWTGSFNQIVICVMLSPKP